MGPLAGVKVVELAGIGPGPFAAMLLADMGAHVLRVSRVTPGGDELGFGRDDVLHRGRPSVPVDLKDPAGRDLLWTLCESADALLEGFRPGVMERLGLGPDRLLAANPRLVYGRMTGYGQDGPLAQEPGHDINYIAVSGVLDAIRRRGERPLFPLNLVGDFGGGGMLLAFGLVCGVLEARSSGRGQVIDAAMIDGAALLSTSIHAMRAAGQWRAEPGGNVLDSGAHFYEVYRTADDQYVAVGALEPRFYAELCRLAGIDQKDLPQWEQDRWPELKERLAAVFGTRARDEWETLAAGYDACLTPVLSMTEAPEHPHNAARGTFRTVDGVLQPAPAPRFSRTPGAIRASAASTDPGQALTDWGVPAVDVRRLQSAGVIGQPSRTQDSPTQDSPTQETDTERIDDR